MMMREEALCCVVRNLAISMYSDGLSGHSPIHVTRRIYCLVKLVEEVDRRKLSKRQIEKRKNWRCHRSIMTDKRQIV